MTEENIIPDTINIPQGTIEGWLSIPSNETVEIAVTRQDLDNLFFAINHMVTANGALQQCLISYSNGNLEAANQHMVESQRANASSLNSLRLLFNALMSNAAAARTRGQ
ncbi:hypothetical protein [Stappia sediminis]|uniref:hypothetical protein n=1 Tax=Stappia sediminis TaxID=2692190 RepID=UPI0013694B61|nr:hypothetical protein [Stappia sediminis]